MRPFTLEEFEKAVGGTLVSGSKEDLVYSVNTDSRVAKPGDAFFAIVGEVNDGHNYLEQVFEKGCNTIVVSKKEMVPKVGFLSFPGEANVIVVEDTTKALQELSKYYLSTLPLIKKIAVTGSVGKTTTRDMVYSVMCQKYKTSKSIKNYNNAYGLPLSIMEFPEDTEVAVLEMGMDDVGEIEVLCALANPDIAVITNVGVSHIEKLGSREAIFKAKMEITTYFDESNHLIVNTNSDMLSRESVSGNYNVITVGSNEDDYIVENIKDKGLDGVEFTLSFNEAKYEVKLNVPGAHNAINGCLALACGTLMDISIEEGIKGLNQIELTERRLSYMEKGSFRIIDDCYNASSESVKSAVNTLRKTEANRRVAVLGDILELGEIGPRVHFEVGEHVGREKIDVLVAAGKNAEFYAKGAESLNEDKSMEIHYFPKVEEAALEINNILKPGDLVLVKGSRGMKMERIINQIEG